MKSNGFILFIVISAFFILSACGGSSSSGSSGTDTGGGAGASGGSTNALTVAEKVSVVDANTSGSSSVSAFLKKLIELSYAAKDLPAASDYNTDPTFTFVEERSVNAFDLINEILCMLDQTQYEAMIGKGDYIAQVDGNQCASTNDDAQSAGQNSQNHSSGSGMPEFEMFTVNSYRADDSSPHIVALWTNQEGSNDPNNPDPRMQIQAKLTIREARSETNPYGIFHMNFRGVDDTGTEIMTGFLRTVRDKNDNIILQFYNKGAFDIGLGEPITFTEKVSLNRSADGSFGVGTTLNDDSGPFGSLSESFDFAFNSDYFLRGNENNQSVCLSRTEFDETALRYNLYYDENSSTPGKRVTRNSGFPIRYESSDGEQFFGWAGYWGLWLPEDTEIPNGATVYKQEFSFEGTKEKPYTFFNVGGKLRRHTKKSVTLGEIAGIPLQWNKCDITTCTQYRVEWDRNDETLYTTGIMDDEDWIWKDTPPTPVGENDMNFSFNFWSEALGGNGTANLFDPQTGEKVPLKNSTIVTFYIEDVVMPGDPDVPGDLMCFESCPNPNNFGVEQSSPYLDKDFVSAAQQVPPDSLVAGTHYAPYTFDASSMTLTYQGKDVVMESDDLVNPWGIWSGVLVPKEEVSKLACEWDQTKTCPWQAWDKLDVFYIWETGANQWNQLTLLKDPDTGTFLKFDPPLTVEYTDTNGTKYYLEYAGAGELQGFPGKCVDGDTGKDIDCAEGGEDKPVRWVPEFSIPNGATVTDVENGATYYVKAIETEQRLKAVDDAECSSSGLSLTKLELPTGDLYETPDIGDKPNVAGAPAVIGGELQGETE